MALSFSRYLPIIISIGNVKITKPYRNRIGSKKRAFQGVSRLNVSLHNLGFLGRRDSSRVLAKIKTGSLSGFAEDMQPKSQEV
jgi:hypothetical protein